MTSANQAVRRSCSATRIWAGSMVWPTPFSPRPSDRRVRGLCRHPDDQGCELPCGGPAATPRCPSPSTCRRVRPCRRRRRPQDHLLPDVRGRASRAPCPSPHTSAIWPTPHPGVLLESALAAPGVHDRSASGGNFACDMHRATRPPPGRAAAAGRPVVAVQHHHAHAVSLLADHRRLDTPILAVTYDGTGYGTDGTIWGGELLIGHRPGRVHPVGHPRGLPARRRRGGTPTRPHRPGPAGPGRRRLGGRPATGRRGGEERPARAGPADPTRVGWHRRPYGWALRRWPACSGPASRSATGPAAVELSLPDGLPRRWPTSGRGRR